MPETTDAVRTYENYRCTLCGTVIPENFWPTMQSKCKMCYIDYRAMLRKAKRDFMAEYKVEMGCADCGYNSHPHALDFDHIGEKEFNLSQGQDKSYKILREEMAKCDVVCANCHRIRTAERGGYYA